MFGCNDTISLGACCILTLPNAGNISTVDMRNGRESVGVQGGGFGNYRASFTATGSSTSMGPASCPGRLDPGRATTSGVGAGTRHSALLLMGGFLLARVKSAVAPSSLGGRLIGGRTRVRPPFSPAPGAAGYSDRSTRAGLTREARSAWHHDETRHDDGRGEARTVRASA
jgi:hypothetical protein